LVLTLALMAGLHGDIRARLLAANPHVVARPASGAAAYSMEDALRVAAEARGVPGVLAAAPFSSTLGLMRSGVMDRPVAVEVKGVDPDGEVTGLAGLTSELAWRRLRQPWT